MTSLKKKTHGWLEKEVLILVFSSLLNEAISHSAHSHTHEMGVLSGDPRQGYQLTDNKTISDRHRDGSSGPDNEEMVDCVFDDQVEKGPKAVAQIERSLRFKLGERFAFRKRLQFALLPIMYKMGVMTTLLTGLTVLVLKGLTIGIILLIFAFGNYFTKLHKHSYQSAQPIHVHVHSQDGHKVSSYPSVAGPWDRVTDEVHPGAYLDDNGLESYRRRLIENSAAMIKFKPTTL